MSALEESQKNTLAKLRELVRVLPGTTETASWGHPNFRTSERIFSAFHEDRDGVPCIWLRLDPLAAELLCDDPRVLRSSHAAAGWIRVRAEGRIDWGFVRELVRDAHAVALPKLKLAKPKLAKARAKTRRR